MVVTCPLSWFLDNFSASCSPVNKRVPVQNSDSTPDGARITDRKIGMIAEIYFKPEGIFCDLDKNNTCEHINFALTVPAIQNIIRKRAKEGWKLPDL